MSIRHPLAVAGFVTSLAVLAPAVHAQVTHSVVLNPGGTVSGDFDLAPFGNATGLQLNNAGEFVFFTQSERYYNGEGDRDDGLVRGNLATPASLSLVGRTGQTIGGDGGPVIAEFNSKAVLNNAGGLLWGFDVSYNNNAIPVNTHADTIVYNGNVIAKSGTTIDGRTFRGALSENVSLSQGGKIAHFLYLPTPADIDSSFPFNEQMELIVNGVSIKRGGTGNSTLAGEPFYGFGQPSNVVANDAGKVAVSAWGGGAFDARLYVIEGGNESVLAENGGIYFQSGSPFNGWKTGFNDRFSMNEAGDVVYSISVENPVVDDDDMNDYATLILKNGVLIAAGQGQTVIGGIPALEVDHFVLNEAGQVAYLYYYDANGSFGLGIAVDGMPIVSTGMVIDGRTIQQLGSSFDFNEVGQLLYTAEFTDGSSALMIATVPEPTTLATLALGSVMLLRRRRMN